MGRRGHASERAFTMIEMIITMVIVLVLASVAFFAFHGARSGASIKETSAAAASYAGAIAAFKLDHYGRVPTLGDAVDWPVAADGPLMLTLDPANRRNRYIRGGAPGAVADRRVVISAAPPATQPVEARGWIQYERAVGARSFTVRTFTRDAADLPWTQRCALADGVITAPAGSTAVPQSCS